MQALRVESFRYRYLPHRPGIEAVSVSRTPARWTEVHQAFTVCTVEHGAPVTYRCNARAYTRCPRVGMLVGPGEAHADTDGTGPSDYRILRLSLRAVEQAATRLGLPCKNLFVAEHEIPSAATNALFLMLHAALDRGVEGPAVDRLADVCIAEVVRRCAPQPVAVFERREVRRAREYIRENLSEPMTLDEIAAASGMGKWGFATLFREQVGVPPHQYVVQLRLARARSLLSTGRPCGEVAFEVGFFDQSHLNRWFVRTYGISPGDYQRTVLGSTALRRTQEAVQRTAS